jgi:hypothetical protein
MRERQASLADGLIEAKALLDGRYRLDALVRRSKTATVHVATHRNGASAWLKMPISVAHGAAIALEASIANGIGSALSVRDDGITREGLPYLVLDPPEAETLAALRAKVKAGARLTLERTTRAGDALISVIVALHAMGYVSGGLDEEDILVFTNDEVALLDLHAVSPASPEGIRADNGHVLRVLAALVEDADVASLAPMRAGLDSFLGGRYADIAVLQAGWRFAFPAPIKTVIRAKSPSIPDLVDSGPRLPVHDTPLVVTVASDEEQPPPDSSIVEYLRSAPLSVAPPSRGPQEKAVMYDPLSKLAEMPRLVQAASRRDPNEKAPTQRGRGLMAAVIGVPLLVVAVTTALIVSSGAPAPVPTSVASNAMASPPAKQAAAASPSPAASAVDLDDDVEILDETPAATSATGAAVAVIPTPLAADPSAEGQTAVLRTDSAPPGRPVYLDGKIVGQTPLEATVPCGRHALQMVAGGASHAVNLPCGGEKVIRYDRRGRWSVK